MCLALLYLIVHPWQAMVTSNLKKIISNDDYAWSYNYLKCNKLNNLLLECLSSGLKEKMDISKIACKTRFVIGSWSGVVSHIQCSQN